MLFIQVLADTSKLRVGTAINLISKDTATYFYGTGGRIMRIQHTKGNSGHYQYLKGAVIKESYEVLRHRLTIDTMLLNREGLADRIKSNEEGQFLITREFNAHGDLILNTYYDKDGKIWGTTTYGYAEGNQINAVSHYPSAEGDFAGTYTYYSGKANTISAENTGTAFTGADSKNPVKSQTSRMAKQQPFISNFYYHYDDKGRIIIKTTYNDKGRLTDSVAYSYY
jgi:hypothetical protein